MIEFYEKHYYHVCPKVKAALLPFREFKFELARSHKRADADLMSPFPESTAVFVMCWVSSVCFHNMYMCPLAARSDAFMALVKFVLFVGMYFIFKCGHRFQCIHSDNDENVMSGILMSW